ncbi:MAG: Ig-like domain-containing protein [Chloroflexi bacterium]|nr:Ig-like domain-containing protein [Chloroflexota bacterium]
MRYTVSLTGCGGTGCKTVRRTDYVTVDPVPPGWLVASFNFDEGSGSTSADLSGKGNTAQIATATWTDGIRGKAVRFDGKDGIGVRVSASDSLQSNSFTFEACLRSAAGGGTIASQGEYGANTRWRLWVDGDRLVLQVWSSGGSSEVRSTSILSGSGWTCIGASFDGQDVKFYREGALHSSARLSTGGINSGSSTLYVGSAFGRTWFSGDIDEVRYWNYATTPSASPTATPTAGPTATPTSTPTPTATPTLTPTPTPTPKGTIVDLSPSFVTIESGKTQAFTATLTDRANTPVSNKSLTWSVDLGVVSPTTCVTDSQGRCSATYTAPTVSSTTNATLRATFSGDASYESNSDVSSITIARPTVDPPPPCVRPVQNPESPSPEVEVTRLADVSASSAASNATDKCLNTTAVSPVTLTWLTPPSLVSFNVFAPTGATSARATLTEVDPSTGTVLNTHIFNVTMTSTGGTSCVKVRLYPWSFKKYFKSLKVDVSPGPGISEVEAFVGGIAPTGWPCDNGYQIDVNGQPQR